MPEQLTDTVKKIIGAKIRKSREEDKLSLRDLAVITNIGHSWLAKLEKGQINFQIDSLTRLLDVLDLQPKDLFEFELNFEE